MAYNVETNTYEPKNIFAGDFPTVTDTGKAGTDITELSPVIYDPTTGTVTVPTADTAAKVNAIAADSAAKSYPVALYLTGEFFETALNLPAGVTASAVKAALRNVSIFLK